MIKLRIDKQNIEVEKGKTVLKAAQQLGIKIPTMCFLEGYSNHPSCMLCVVKDVKTGKLFPSCAMPAQENMDIITFDEEIEIARREALELLLSDHVGDCEAPCRPSCPAFMNIPKMNRLIASGNFALAHKTVKEHIALPLVLGYICPAPCEKACRRTQIDDAVSICQLKKTVAIDDFQNNHSFLPEKKKKSGKKIAVIGSGPAGLASAFYILAEGHECDVYDKNEKIGGALAYEVLENQLPADVLLQEVELIKKYGAKFILNTEIDKNRFEKELIPNYDAIILATGDYFGSKIENFGLEESKNGILVNKNNYATQKKGVFACGNIVRSRRMSVNAVAQGRIAAFSASKFVNSEDFTQPERMFNSKFGKLREAEIVQYQKEAITDARQKTENGKLGNLTFEQAVIEAKRCLHCDCRKADDCKLRIFSDQYNASQAKFAFIERKSLKKYFEHELIIYEPEKCIRCNLCVDIAQKDGEKIGLSSVKRGFRVEISVPFDKNMTQALQIVAIKCANACPTGALSVK